MEGLLKARRKLRGLVLGDNQRNTFTPFLYFGGAKNVHLTIHFWLVSFYGKTKEDFSFGLDLIWRWEDKPVCKGMSLLICHAFTLSEMFLLISLYKRAKKE